MEALGLKDCLISGPIFPSLQSAAYGVGLTANVAVTAAAARLLKRSGDSLLVTFLQKKISLLVTKCNAGPKRE